MYFFFNTSGIYRHKLKINSGLEFRILLLGSFIFLLHRCCGGGRMADNSCSCQQGERVNPSTLYCQGNIWYALSFNPVRGDHLSVWIAFTLKIYRMKSTAGKKENSSRQEFFHPSSGAVFHIRLVQASDRQITSMNVLLKEHSCSSIKAICFS